MTIALAMIVRDCEATLPACLESVRDLVDSAVIVDTGSADDTPLVARDFGGTVYSVPWVDFGHNRTQLLELARGTADWLLLLDSDQTVEFHPGLKAWLADDPDSEVGAWMVEVKEFWGRYRLPLLVRGHTAWRYEGKTHEGLVLDGEKSRSLLGLTVHHHPDHGPEKHERDLELLRDGFVVGDPRATFYTAQALRALGMVEEAAEVYSTRARMNGWEEEAWYAEYQAALLREDVDGLLKAWRRRPSRHEPLTAASRIVHRVESDDVLFREDQ